MAQLTIFDRENCERFEDALVLLQKVAQEIQPMTEVIEAALRAAWELQRAEAYVWRWLDELTYATARGRVAQCLLLPLHRWVTRGRTTRSRLASRGMSLARLQSHSLPAKRNSRSRRRRFAIDFASSWRSNTKRTSFKDRATSRASLP